MQLNYKRTFLVGLAFFSICTFWQVYDGLVPLMLKNTFHVGDSMAGVIMALDNILALFLLPLFGAISDRAGKRMPFIVGGALAAAVLIVILPLADRSKSLALFFVALGLLLLCMGTYRSPAVALMPDVTPKPLRSKGNAVINLMGTLGGALSLVIVKLLVTKTASGGEDYLFVFLAVAVLMILSTVVLSLTIREKTLVDEMRKINYGVDPAKEAAETADAGGNKLSPDVMRSLLLILLSVAFWYMGYNAVTTAFTKYAATQWGQGVGGAANCLLIATGGAMVSYIPIGMLSSKFGRKRIIQLGILLLCACFVIGAVAADRFHPALYAMFLVVGFAWAAINVNSYPMVVELSRGSDVGKYTGYYYTFSMAAQIVTPIVSGTLLEHVGYWTLFPYAAVLVALSFVTMSLSRHGDNRPQAPASRLEAFDTAD
ncbi:MAG: MFS transporter [Bacillota bacterium]